MLNYDCHQNNCNFISNCLQLYTNTDLIPHSQKHGKNYCQKTAIYGPVSFLTWTSLKLRFNSSTTSLSLSSTLLSSLLSLLSTSSFYKQGKHFNYMEYLFNYQAWNFLFDKILCYLTISFFVIIVKIFTINTCYISFKKYRKF